MSELGRHYHTPSGGDRWISCAASGYLYRLHQPPYTKSQPAAEGNVAHKVAELCKKKGMKPKHFLGKTFTEQGFKIEVDQQMIDGVALYLKIIGRKYAMSAVEMKVTSFWDRGRHGFIDFMGRHRGERILRVIDFKYGYTPVKVTTWQGKLYAGAIVAGVAGIMKKVDTVRFEIVSPRATDGVTHKTVDYTLDDVNEFMEEAVNAHEFAMSIDSDSRASKHFSPSDDACKWCEFRGSCAARAEHFADTLGFENLDDDEESFPKVGKMSDTELGNVLSSAEALRRFLVDAEREGLQRLNEGRNVTGWKVVRSNTRRAWRDPEKALKYLTRLMSKAEVTKQAIRTPNQIEELTSHYSPTVLKRIQEMIYKPEGGLTIAPESDHRASHSVIHLFKDETKKGS